MSTGTIASPRTTKANMTAGNAYQPCRCTESQAVSSSTLTAILGKHCHAATNSALTASTTERLSQMLTRRVLIRVTALLKIAMRVPSQAARPIG